MGWGWDGVVVRKSVWGCSEGGWGWGWGEEGRTADQTSPCDVWKESDPGNLVEVYCESQFVIHLAGLQFSLLLLFRLEKRFNHLEGQ